MEWYRIFLHTAKLGNLTKAAQQLHMTQPSVSYAIKQLEENLGVKLFDRLSKGVQLTPEGAALLDYVEPSFALIDSAERRLQALKDFAAGDLRIGASGPMFKHLLLPALDSFRIGHPAVRIHLFQGKSSEIAKRLKDGLLDLGLVHQPMDNDPELDITTLAAIQDCLVGGPAYRGLAAHPLSAPEIAKIPLLLLSPDSSTGQFIGQWLGAQGVRVEAAMELSSLEMQVECCERGYGAAFVTRRFVEQQLAAGSLLELPTCTPIPPRSVGIAARKGLSLSLIAGQFMKELSRHSG
ncbi:LysR family transcriptional regulator [Paenibacillus nasutitermitis]|uniref:LysR family transcriptional regulator n=2 Tax=Paenibacillus nasutitermitis TaxID=1652958 RepID=A0A916ZFN9_9BACL|nr:LysR family transcriptional regulator [Paenibacillus nasutitermitis]